MITEEKLDEIARTIFKNIMFLHRTGQGSKLPFYYLVVSQIPKEYQQIIGINYKIAKRVEKCIPLNLYLNITNDNRIFLTEWEWKMELEEMRYQEYIKKHGK